MKKIAFQLLLTFLSISVFSQTIDSLVREGIKLHDQGKLTDAIAMYQQALEIDPESSLVHYELSLSYMHLKEYAKSIEHSDKVIKANGEHLLPAYISNGSCLDYLGKTKQSIKVFKKGLKKFGPHYLLSYNLAYTYYRTQKIEEAIEQLEAAIKHNNYHQSSHYLLGIILSEQNQRVQSLLSLHYFLFLEPNSDRSEIAYQVLYQQFNSGASRDKNKPNTINVNISSDQSSEFRPADLMISMLGATKFTEENQEKSEEELFIENTKSFFSILGELKEKNNNKSIWWDFYIPFFYKLAQSNHLDTYCNYISQIANESANEWLNKNEEKLNAFDAWLKKTYN